MPAPPWTPDTVSFFRTLDTGRPQTLIVDLAAVEAGPVASHPVLVLLEFALQNPRRDGLRFNDESAAVNAADDALTALVGDAIDGWPVARMTTAGHVTLHFMCPSELTDTVDLTAASGPYTVERSFHRDPSWSYLRDALAPDAAEQRQIASLRQLAVLKRQGDPGTGRRLVDWTVTLPDEAAAGEAGRELRAAGYALSQPSALIVVATRSHDLDLIALLERQEQIAAIAERHGGELDGWGAPIVRAAPRRRRWLRRR